MKSCSVSLVFAEQKLNAHTHSGAENTDLISLTASARGLITAKSSGAPKGHMCNLEAAAERLAMLTV